jgi:hypothetical protein
MASQLSLTSLVWKNLLRRRLRTLPAICGIGMAISIFAGPVSFSDAFDPRPFRHVGFTFPAFQQLAVLQSVEAPPHPMIPMRARKAEA